MCPYIPGAFQPNEGKYARWKNCHENLAKWFPDQVITGRDFKLEESIQNFFGNFWSMFLLFVADIGHRLDVAQAQPHLLFVGRLMTLNGKCVDDRRPCTQA